MVKYTPNDGEFNVIGDIVINDGKAQIDNINIDGNTITTTSGDLTLSGNGTGVPVLETGSKVYGAGATTNLYIDADTNNGTGLKFRENGSEKANIAYSAFSNLIQLANASGNAMFLYDTGKIALTSANAEDIDLNGYKIKSDGSAITKSGITANRPPTPTTGQTYFDTTLGQPIWYDGSNWIDATGTTV